MATPSVSPAPLLTTIYVLKDPRDGAIRYVGMTIGDVEDRLKRHLGDTYPSHKTAWLGVLKRRRLRPTIEVLEVVTGEGGAERERYWIAEFSARGEDLTNGSPGGEGPSAVRVLVRCGWCGEERHSQPNLLRLSKCGRSFCTKSHALRYHRFVKKHGRPPGAEDVASAPPVFLAVTCAHCGAVVQRDPLHFNQNKGGRFFCSKAHRRAYHQSLLPPPAPKPQPQHVGDCGACGKVVFRWKGQSRTHSNAVFCNMNCRRAFWVNQTGIVQPCGWCGKPVRRRPSRLRLTASGLFFCNHSCHTSHRNTKRVKS